MSYETPEQKELLRKLEEASVACAEAQIAYGKALTALNQGYGTERKRMSDADLKARQGVSARRQFLAKASAVKAKAIILSRMTGEQIRLARGLPEEMAAKIADDQLVGDVFTLDELEKVVC